ncbi:MAG TPA: hypothetical protein DDY18_05115 [Flavobacterium sp.]|jgi:hypothetical protein|nr:hypothetical protein [Flavobacterium sp.]
MKVYHVTFNHQIEPGDYGLFSTKEKAEQFLKDHFGVDITQAKNYSSNSWFYPGGYQIQEKAVK